MKIEFIDDSDVRRHWLSGEDASPTAADAELQELWRSFWSDRRREPRNRLASRYQYVIGSVISRLNPELRSYWDFDDLYGFGYVGLLEAIERFREDSPLGAFNAYVAQRIRGSIMDELRKLDWLPRSIRDRANEVRATANQMTLESGTTPSRASLLDAMGMSRAKGDGVFVAMRDVSVLSIDQLNVSVGDVIVSRDEGPEAEVLRCLSQEAALQALKDLPTREREVITLRYLGGLTQAAVGAMMGLTHSRICQIEAGALSRLRSSPSFRTTDGQRAASRRKSGEKVPEKAPAKVPLPLTA